MAVTQVMQNDLTPFPARTDPRAVWLDQVLEQLGAARAVVDKLGHPGLSQRIAQAQTDAARLRRR